MADVKWIKFYVSILTDPKIKRIRRMPDGNTIALIWAYLLAQAGKSNKDGAIYFTDEIPYSNVDFAEDYNFNLKTVELAIITFERFGMIELYDGIVYVKNWEKYQNTDGLEKMKEQNRIRQSRYKEKQKLLQNNVISNVTDNDEVTQGNAIDIDIEIDKEIEEEKEIKKEKKKRNKEVVTYVPDVLLNQTINDFIASRKKKSPMTDKAIELIIKKLDEMTNDNDEKIQIINQSIMNGWKGIFPLKNGYNKKPTTEEYAKKLEEWANG
jgi:predicted phage replisome organizer